jgi:hypothetical protein
MACVDSPVSKTDCYNTAPPVATFLRERPPHDSAYLGGLHAFLLLASAQCSLSGCSLSVADLLFPVQISREKLVMLGTQIGKWTHSGKFRITIGALDLLSQYARYKVCTPSTVSR